MEWWEIKRITRYILENTFVVFVFLKVFFVFVYLIKKKIFKSNPVSNLLKSKFENIGLLLLAVVSAIIWTAGEEQRFFQCNRLILPVLEAFTDYAPLTVFPLALAWFLFTSDKKAYGVELFNSSSFKKRKLITNLFLVGALSSLHAFILVKTIPWECCMAFCTDSTIEEHFGKK